MTNDDGTIRYTYNEANQLIEAGDTTYYYDNNGNVIGKDNGSLVEYEYNGANQLIGAYFEDYSYAAYSYDALGRLIFREEANVKHPEEATEEKSNNGKANGKDKPTGNDKAQGNGQGLDKNNDKSNNGKGNSKSPCNSNSKGNSKSNNGKSSSGKGVLNAAENGNGLKKGLYKNKLSGEDGLIPPEDLDIEKTTFQYQGLSNILNKEYGENGQPYAEYYIGPNNQVVARNMTGLHGLVTPGHEPDLRTTGGLMYYHYDGLNTVSELTDRHGDLIEQYRYDGFGNIMAGITAPFNSFTFTGQMYDDKSSLINMNARWYDPNAGRFMTEDTYRGDLVNPLSQHQYAYVMNNPINYIDPTGHVPEWFNATTAGKQRHSKVWTTDYNSVVTETWTLENVEVIETSYNTIETIVEDRGITHLVEVTQRLTYDYLYEISEIMNGRELETGSNHDIFNWENVYHVEDFLSAEEIAAGNQLDLAELGEGLQNREPTYSYGVKDGKAIGYNEFIIDPTKKGNSASNKIIQAQLNNVLGLDLELNGVYGQETIDGVKLLQKKLGLEQTGMFDANTQYQLTMYLERQREAEDQRLIAKGVLVDIDSEVSNTLGAVEDDSNNWGITKTLKNISSEDVLDAVQTGLDIGGLVPGLGEPLDAVNAGIYLLRGDKVNAALSAAAMMPIGGQAATAGKLANKALKYSDEAADASKMLRDIPKGTRNDIIVHPFSSGASHITTSNKLARYPDSPTYGGPQGLYVAPSDQIDNLLKNAKSRRDIEINMGLEAGSLDGGDLIRIDIENPFSRNLRLPDPSTGNIHHRSGTGLTTGNINESVIDSPFKNDSNINTSIIDWIR